MPGGANQVRNQGDYSESDKTGETTSQADFALLYGSIPTCSELGTDTGENTETESCLPGRSRPSNENLLRHEQPPRELSGRSGAILKEYFSTADPYTFPVGHRTVASTEPQIYHLLRALTDEVIIMSCSAIEKMVIGAVKGTPATAPSRTEQFRTRTRAPNPGHRQIEDSSCEGITTGLGSGTETFGDISVLQGDEDHPLPDESDSSGEMALIAGTFKKSALSTRFCWRRG